MAEFMKLEGDMKMRILPIPDEFRIDIEDFSNYLKEAKDEGLFFERSAAFKCPLAAYLNRNEKYAYTYGVGIYLDNRVYIRNKPAPQWADDFVKAVDDRRQMPNEVTAFEAFTILEEIKQKYAETSRQEVTQTPQGQDDLSPVVQGT